MDMPRDEQLTSHINEVARRAVQDLVPHTSGDLPEGVLSRLKAASTLRASVDQIVTQLVIGARDDGATWAEIGEVLGVSTQAAHQKYRHIAAVAAVSAGNS